MRRLARDVRGNTIMIFAFAIFPLLGMIGGGLDISRLYLVKTRLQHACDAGALAGRKQMGGGAWTTTGATSSDAIAKQLFDGNFATDQYAVTASSRSFAQTAGVVTGTAQATVPMTLMKVFQTPDVTLNVTCSAQEDVPNTDVVFVLDNTESMSETPDNNNHLSVITGGTLNADAKILTLKSAVKCFFEAITKQDTGEGTCDAITGVAPTSRIRFGLVPYSTNVNIGALGLPASYFAPSWKYQSRVWSSGQWKYDQVSLTLPTISPGTTSIGVPLGASGASTNLTWDGCVEENTPLTDINALPTVGTPTTQYAPTLPGAVYFRKQPKDSPLYAGSTVNPSNLLAASFSTTADLFVVAGHAYYYNCPAKMYAPAEYKSGGTLTVNDFLNRVNAMTYGGNTRHDIGLLWGGRLISPRGIYSSTNSTAPNGGKIYRHVIFMTDGDAKANECDYASYGIPWYDKRETAGAAVDGSACNNIGDENEDLTARVVTRTKALCESIKAEDNTVLWVITFGQKFTHASTKADLTACASDSNHFYDATNSDQLRKAFKSIASQISQLRLKQ